MMLNNRSGGSSSSQRSGRTTPIGQAAVMGNTPSPKEMRSLRTPSPSGQRMTTPSSGQKGKKEWQPFHPSSGPNRLLVRPPPCNGKIISPKGLHNTATPGSTAMLPGPHVGSMDGHGTSPMSLSPVLTQPQRPLLSSNAYTTPIPTRGTGPGAVPHSLPGRIQKQRQSPQPMTGVQHGPPSSYMIPSAMDQQSNLTQSQGRRFIPIPNHSTNVTPVPATGWRQGVPSSVPPRIITLSRQKTT
ncbi:uncharacterized protein [Dysidea avara]|uniref:uncharacterized protein n=1 Tax=Dysidea avara TaxID=196820 RepID=UPI0033270EE6